MSVLQIKIDEIIKTALMEDINYIDITSDYLLDDDNMSSANFISKANGVICGVDIAARVFSMIDNKILIKKLLSDGCRVKPGDVILNVKGSTKSILKAERTALNLIQHLSGISSMTARCVELVRGTSSLITDTRKTIPGMRTLQKYAVAVGGGRNHRFNLSDCAMIKDNHIDAFGGIAKTVDALKNKIGHMVKIEVETRNLDEVKEAVNCGVDVIMLDNMSFDMMRKAVKIINGKAKTEASGNITEDNLLEVAKTGVDIISLGALTHSVKAFDISLKIS